VEFVRWFEANRHYIDFCYIEKVRSSPQQGVVSAFSFGENYGFLRGVIFSILKDTNKIFDVSPQIWQGQLNLKTKSADRTSHKNELKDVASNFWPETKWTHALADAALIARFGLMKQSLQLPETHELQTRIFKPA